MSRLKKWFGNWRKQFKFAIYDPKSFNEIFGVTTSKIRVVSLVVLAVFVVSGLFLFLIKITPLGSYFQVSSAAGHTEIAEQRIRMDSLTKKVQTQEIYIRDLKRLMFGDFKADSLAEGKPVVQIDPNTINPNPGKAEMQIGENVKADQYTNSPKQTAEFVHFMSPVTGKISQRFVAGKHEAIDVAAPADSYFSACLAGTVVFSGYSQKDGNILIIGHANDFLSVYKHAKTVLKKQGDKVGAGDMIGVVGNTGENSTGTHLHFELWLNQQAVDPQKYMKFE